MNRIVPLALATLALFTSYALATDAIIKHRATLRQDPSTERPPITSLQQGEDVELIEPSPTANYYHVRTAEGEEGWVYGHNLQIVPDQLAAPAIVPNPAPAAGGALLSAATIVSNI